MYVDTKIIADSIREGNDVNSEKLQYTKDLAYNKMLEETFEERAYAKHGTKYADMSNLEKMIAKEYLLTQMLRKVY